MKHLPTLLRRPVMLLASGLAAALIGTSLPDGVAASAAQTPGRTPGQSAAQTRAAAKPFTVTPLWFRVEVGPDRATTCLVVADLYLPRAASRTRPVPAIMATNGFGGSKDGLAGYGREFARQGYALLAYSGLGFGGSSCAIHLDDPLWDGRAAQQLVSYLGGATGAAFLDADLTRPAPALQVIRRDTRDHTGRRSVNDPRVGMVGGSYGGGAQFAAAAEDPRIDAIVPLATWNDLSYSLAPNNVAGQGVVAGVPGAPKTNWALGFVAAGVASGLTNLPADTPRLIGCPNFETWVCSSLALAGVTGTIDATTQGRLHRRSVAGFIDRIRIPTLLGQGQGDTLFNLNEAVATYEALRSRGVPTQMIWFNGGHSADFAPGEIDEFAVDTRRQYVAGRIKGWFDRYLKDLDVSTGPGFTYFRDWVRYRGNARPAYGTAPRYPLPSQARLYLSGSALVPDTASARAVSRSLLTPPAGAPTSFDPLDVFGGAVPVPLPELDLPGTALDFTTAPLPEPFVVAGVPTLRLGVSAPLAEVTGIAGSVGGLTLFVKLLDVAPDGTTTLIRNLVAPARVLDPQNRFTVRLPAIVHRFKTGHRVRLVVAGGSTNYRSGPVPMPVTITTGASQVLTLPTPG
ncbi:CocE/NonD family hydrolase [Nocardioides sp. R-C-SC26]|uniref:CocE/NonD family hydrolase n=1 Tax=Nocardioides sp. R-C-SC26 TaxID=2870414 RepID=UPI001E38EC4E|nr:CocE/NonD family hydrolase [Nocardioides sp. R-C-SC26]